MSLIERDLFKWFWELPLWLIGLITILGSFGAIYLIELYRSFKDDSRLPWGLSVFHWTTNFVGDPVFITGILIGLALFYSRVRVGESIWTSRGFSISQLILGLTLAVAFIAMEEMAGSFPPGHKWNVNRVYHFFLFAFFATQLIGGLRILWYGIIEGQERGLAVIILLLFAGYATAFVIDGKGWNPWWDYLKGQHPDKTWYL